MIKFAQILDEFAMASKQANKYFRMLFPMYEFPEGFLFSLPKKVVYKKFCIVLDMNACLGVVNLYCACRYTEKWFWDTRVRVR